MKSLFTRVALVLILTASLAACSSAHTSSSNFPSYTSYDSASAGTGGLPIMDYE